ncbi:hypothetical protein MJG53_002163 [Ovis ammon polii x Ovis aries]|uniref:Uncharacterized protein n=1 Tax=Ovis ammon polii x Ovis aries TaxID=2918886 RepID=A0ACB9VNK7_9CETA|nr:hypothetical protein MJG53_002163 [Ovis ammon polii x Ovis aries]
MAGYVPGQQPANRNQEKEFVQAYEDVLERYKAVGKVPLNDLPVAKQHLLLIEGPGRNLLDFLQLCEGESRSLLKYP